MVPSYSSETKNIPLLMISDGKLKQKAKKVYRKIKREKMKLHLDLHKLNSYKKTMFK
jgi:hypothetical protein